MGSGDRLHRLLEIIHLLQSGRAYNSAELADACQVSRRTIFRDIKTLCEAGILVERNDEEMGYSLVAHEVLPPSEFSMEETFSLLILCEELADQTHGVPFQEAARSAAAKLMGSLPEHVRTRIHEMRRTVSVQLAPHNTLSDSHDNYRRLTDALMKRQQVEIQYRRPLESEPLKIRICPYHVLFKQRSWYVIGRSLTHNQVRTFNMGRISHVKGLDANYKIPRSFRLSRYLGNAWSLIRETGDSHDVVIRFQPMVAQNVAEVQWHKTQKLDWRPDGTLDFHANVEGLTEIAWWILGYGDQAEVLKPKKLRQQIQQRIESMRQVYAKP
ncbi:MAG: YafY family transcriptional regulator [Planctomycetaceae bacterium]|nr:YafY family transcriptional regulator [Planctomycetaceae bacterium]